MTGFIYKIFNVVSKSSLDCLIKLIKLFIVFMLIAITQAAAPAWGNNTGGSFYANTKAFEEPHLFRQMLSIEDVVFIGTVRGIQEGKLDVEVLDVIKSSVPLPRNVIVIYDPQRKNLDLGAIYPGDEVLVFGSLAESTVIVNNDNHYILNLAYQGTREMKTFNLKSVRKFNFKQSPAFRIPIAGHSITVRLDLETLITDEASFEIVLTRLGLGGPGKKSLYLLYLTPGSDNLEASLKIGISIPGYVDTKLYEIQRVYDVGLRLGETSEIILDTFTLYEEDIGIATIQIDLEPLLTVLPATFSCRIDLLGSRTDDVFNHVGWRGHDANVIIVHHTDYETTLNLTECVLYTSNLRLDLRIVVRWRTIIGIGDGSTHFTLPLLDLGNDFRDFQGFSYHHRSMQLLTIYLPKLMGSFYIKINDNVYSMDSQQALRLALPRGKYTIAVPQKISISLLESHVFSGWSNLDGGAQTEIDLVSNIDIAPVYQRRPNLGVLTVLAIIGISACLTIVSVVKKSQKSNWEGVPR